MQHFLGTLDYAAQGIAVLDFEIKIVVKSHVIEIAFKSWGRIGCTSYNQHSVSCLTLFK